MSEKDATNGALKDSRVIGQNSEGVVFSGTLLRLTRQVAVFELYNPTAVLRFSESLGEFKIVCNQRVLYSGKAVVRNLMNTNPSVVACEVTLNDNSWIGGAVVAADAAARQWPEEYRGFLAEWQKSYRVLPEFKNVMMGMQSFLHDLQLWLNQVELEMGAVSAATPAGPEQKILDELAAPIGRSLDVFVDQFEGMVAKFDGELAAQHQVYLRRQLHPYLMCAPFAHRAFHKPLGYAGDYEMVDMMLRSPYEGGSWYAKLVNAWLVNQSPATAHRNRVTYLIRKLVEETLRCAPETGTLRVFNMGCGPADEVQQFLKQKIADRVSLTLADFNEQTLTSLQQNLDEKKRKYQRHTKFHLIKKSIHQVLKESANPALYTPDKQYDYVYCAGLFDYLSNQVCKQMMNTFYNMLAPGGLLVATNVSDAMNPARPFRYSMEYMLDWHLIYRDGRDMARLAPDAAPPDSVAISTEHIGVNVFIEVRKPTHD